MRVLTEISGYKKYYSRNEIIDLLEKYGEQKFREGLRSGEHKRAFPFYFSPGAKKFIENPKDKQTIEKGVYIPLYGFYITVYAESFNKAFEFMKSKFKGNRINFGKPPGMATLGGEYDYYIV